MRKMKEKLYKSRSIDRHICSLEDMFSSKGILTKIQFKSYDDQFIFESLRAAMGMKRNLNSKFITFRDHIQ